MLPTAAAAAAVAAAFALLGPAQQASAQAVSAAGRADPLDARAAVPTVRFSSAFAPYRRMSETPVGSWREANDTVTQIGGWRAYAREANTPVNTPVNTPASAPNSASSGPGGAHEHGGHAPK